MLNCLAAMINSSVCGECQDISYETLRIYITALNIRIQRRKRQSETALVHVPKPTEPPPKVVRAPSRAVIPA
jgi:hypothetical protein